VASLRAVRVRSLGDEDGFSLLELLLSVVVFGFVLAAVLSMLDTTSSLSTRDQERPAAIQEARTGLASMVRELRQAYQVVSASPNRMEVLVRLNGVDKDVSYECDVAIPGSTLRRCYRRAATNGQPLPPLGQGKVVVDRLVNGTTADPVFCSLDADTNVCGPPDPTADASTYYGVTVKVPTKGRLKRGYRGNVVFNDGFSMPNIAAAEQLDELTGTTGGN
jgi:prepilin-type N-terminal cleavage/methylation domain-containing protein